MLIYGKGDTDTDTDTFHLEKSILILIRYFLVHEFRYWYDTDTILFSKKYRTFDTDTIVSKTSDPYFCQTTVIKISKIQFTQFLHTYASKLFLRALPRYYMFQPMLNILFYIALLSSKILVLFGLHFRAGNSKFQRPKIPARSVPSGIHFKADA